MGGGLNPVAYSPAFGVRQFEIESRAFSHSNLKARFTGVPSREDDGRKLLHLGFSYSHLFRDEDNDTTIRYLGFPESFLAPINYVDTEPFVVNSVDMINPEFALVYGPFSLQGEYMHNFARRSENNPDFWGWYVFASYFLTGEHPPYKNGAFQRIRPNRNPLGEDGGWGPWKLGL